MSRLGYNLLPLDNMVSGLLREEKTARVRSCDKWFICECCSGSGLLTARGEDGYLKKGTFEPCELCHGTGKIQLRLSVERIK